MLEITAATVAAANTDTLRKMASQAKIQNIRNFKTAELREMLLGCIRVWNSELPTEAAKEKKVTKRITPAEAKDLFVPKKESKPSAHADCDHAHTKAARAACRRSRKAEAIAGAQVAAQIADK